MGSKIGGESENEDEHFGNFMKVNKPKINLSDNVPSTSASQLLLEHETDEDPIAKLLKNGKKTKGRATKNRRKQACSQTPPKKAIKKQKLKFEESNNCAEGTQKVSKPANKKKVKAPKSVKRKVPGLLSISDDDGVSSVHQYMLRPKCTKLNQEEVITVASSPAETTSAIGEEELVHLPILETVQEELQVETDQCGCCKLEKKNCAKRSNNGEEQKSLLDDLQVLQESNQNMEKYILQQHINLLKHPEMDSLCNSIDDSNTNKFLTQGKREWIQNFLDSMMADRIDYVKPDLVNSVQGLQHSSVETDTPVSETDHLHDSVTIVKRIDFEKDRKTRLSQLLKRQSSLSVTEPATPSFRVNHLGVTSTPINYESILPIKSIQTEEDNIDISKLDYSFVTMRTPMKSNVNEEQKSCQIVAENTNREESHSESHAIPVNDHQENLEIPRLADTDSLPESNSQNLGINSYIPRHLRPPPEAMNEQQIMSFVDDLLGAESAAITQLIDDNFERIAKYNETTRTPNADNVINLIDDIYNSAMNDSVILIDDNVDDVQIVDDIPSPIMIEDASCIDPPSTSRGPKRKNGVSCTTGTACYEPSKKRRKEKGECPICLEPLDSKEISSTTCGHIFCTPCIKEAIKQTRKCPNCRKGLTLKKIHPLYL